MRPKLIPTISTFLLMFLLISESLVYCSKKRSKQNTKMPFNSDDFNMDNYISVKDRNEWYQYLAEYSHEYNQDNTVIWRSVNPVVCYLTLRVFPLEYVDELQKVFSRLRFSSNCGNTKDVILMSPIIGNNPYTKKEHPTNISVRY